MVAPAAWSNEKMPPVAPPYTIDWAIAARLPILYISIGSLMEARVELPAATPAGVKPMKDKAIMVMAETSRMIKMNNVSLGYLL